MEKKNAVYTIMEEQSPEEARREHILLIARNFAAGAAAVLFLASFALADIHKLLRAAAYFLGAGAYFAEILVLTDGFRRKVAAEGAVHGLLLRPAVHIARAELPA